MLSVGKAGNPPKTVASHSGIGIFEKIPTSVSIDNTMLGIIITFFKISSALEGTMPFSITLFGKIILAPFNVVIALKPI